MFWGAYAHLTLLQRNQSKVWFGVHGLLTHVTGRPEQGIVWGAWTLKPATGWLEQGMVWGAWPLNPATG